jgi:gas vesicle protein
MFLRFRFGRLMMWMAVAAAAMYFLDPVLGEKRRQQLRETIESYRRSAEQSATDLRTSVR